VLASYSIPAIEAKGLTRPYCHNIMKPFVRYHPESGQVCLENTVSASSPQLDNWIHQPLWTPSISSKANTSRKQKGPRSLLELASDAFLKEIRRFRLEDISEDPTSNAMTNALRRLNSKCVLSSFCPHHHPSWSSSQPCRWNGHHRSSTREQDKPY
jgi:hypothetical protein